MKTILLIVAFIASILAAPKCFEDYENAAYTVEKKHIKIQSDYAKQNVRYVYQFEPITMFPFFCSHNDSLRRYLTLNTDVVYLCNNSVSIRKNKDRLGIFHVQIVILSYTLPRGGVSSFRTYTMYFLKQREDKTWTEEQNPKVVTLYLVNKEKEIYQCK